MKLFKRIPQSWKWLSWNQRQHKSSPVLPITVRAIVVCWALKSRNATSARSRQIRNISPKIELRQIKWRKEVLGNSDTQYLLFCCTNLTQNIFSRTPKGISTPKCSRKSFKIILWLGFEYGSAYIHRTWILGCSQNLYNAQDIVTKPTKQWIFTLNFTCSISARFETWIFPKLMVLQALHLNVLY